MIHKQPFGKTGQKSSATIFGAAALGNVTQSEADDTLKTLQKYGVNHIDTAASYGESECRIGPWMEKHRQDFFLATKTGMRAYKDAKAEFQNSLTRLQVKQVDLIQLHNLTHPDDWDLAMSHEGAIQAVIEARDSGQTSLIGVTGHGLLAPSMHMRSLKRFDFDSVLLPLNYILFKDSRYRREFEELLKTCKDKGVAIQTIKSITKGPWSDKTHTTNTWYEPLIDQQDIDLAVHWILGTGYVFLNTASDIHILPNVLDAASRYVDKPTDEMMEKLVSSRKMTRLFVS